MGALPITSPVIPDRQQKHHTQLIRVGQRALQAVRQVLLFLSGLLSLRILQPAQRKGKRRWRGWGKRFTPWPRNASLGGKGYNLSRWPALTGTTLPTGKVTPVSGCVYQPETP